MNDFRNDHSITYTYKKGVIDANTFIHAKGLVGKWVGTINNIACLLMNDALALIKDTPLDRNNAKFLKKAFEVYSVYEENMRKELLTEHAYQVWMDMTDIASDGLKDQVAMLRQSVYNAFVKAKMPYAKEKAYVMAPYIILNYSVCSYDSLMKELKARYKVDFAKYFENLCVREVRRLWIKGADAVIARNVKFLDDDKDCQIAFKAIENKLFEDDFMLKVDDAALEYNAIPENEHVRKDVKKRLKKVERQIEAEKQKDLRTKTLATTAQLNALKEKYNSR